MSRLSELIKDGHASIAVVGLGYVGMPLAVAFAAKGIKVIGYDVNKNKIELYNEGIDLTSEIGNDSIKQTSVYFTSSEEEIKKAKFIIIAVPTPVNSDHTPNLESVEEASKVVGRNLQKGSIVCYESTVYPGVTEDICLLILEKNSGLKCGKDFKIAYSPERINPGDNKHRLENICKIVSGMDSETLEEVKKVYEFVIEAGVYPVSSIKTAEAVKVVENSQRDINIAFMNELAMVFDRMGIDTQEVVDGMNTKWNALGFRPGLVGGHCIGVDPYYFIYQAERLGYHSQIILNGRIINDGMGRFVADAIIRELIRAELTPSNCKIAIMGITFKENCPDIRNSKVIDILLSLRELGIDSTVCDPYAQSNETKKEYGIELVNINDVRGCDCVVFAVAHDEFRTLSWEKIKGFYNTSTDNKKVLIDVKGIKQRQEALDNGYNYWRL